MKAPVSCQLDLKDKVAIVTGGAGGIGFTVAKALSRNGANVVISDIVPTESKKEELFVIGNDVSAVECDITNENDVAELVNFTIKKYGRVDILVHCSGVLKTSSIEETDLNEWERVLKINLTGTFMMCKAVFPHMREQKHGKIVCIGSVAGEAGGISAGPHYVASKGGVHSLIKGLALEGAEYGIYVNGIAPGPVHTEMTKDVAYNENSFPLKRLGEPEDIAEGVLYLVSQSSNWVTGQIVGINGGSRV